MNEPTRMNQSRRMPSRPALNYNGHTVLLSFKRKLCKKRPEKFFAVPVRRYASSGLNVHSAPAVW